LTYLCCDDVNEAQFGKLEALKERVPALKVTCFVMGKDAGDYLRKDWIEVACHGWEHDDPPECERENQEVFIRKGLEALKPYLPQRFGFRAPGFQMTARSYPILREMGFHYVAHQNKVQAFKGQFEPGKIINTHIYDSSLERVEAGNEDFRFLSEGLN